MAVEFGAVNANEFRLSVEFDTTAAAHTCPVNHNGIERYLCGDVIPLCYRAAELHHYGRADCKDLVRFFLALAEFFERFGYEGFSSIRAVVRCNYQFVAEPGEFILEDEQLFISCAEDAADFVSGLF